MFASKMNMSNVQLFSASLFVVCLFASRSFQTLQPYHNETYHLNVTNCRERLQIVSPDFLQLLEMAACSAQTYLNTPTSSDTSAADDAHVVNVTAPFSMFINNTRLERLSNNEFCKVPYLNQLILSNNRFQDGDVLGFGKNCEPESCGLRLTTLALEGNRLNSIKGNSFLCNMRNLGNLYLQNNGLKSIEVNAFANASSLHHVYVSNNSLVGLARGTFANLSHLWTLDLSYNKLKRINFFGDRDLHGLGNLDLNNNEIETLESGGFKGLVSMLYLTLANNNISTIADGAFDSLKKLDELRLQYNYLTRLSKDTLRGLSSLVILEVSNNEINYIQQGTFQHVPNLTSLFLQNNQLNVMPPFSEMKAMETLVLGHNLLRTVANESFWNLPNLKKLDLSFNQIVVLEDNCFHNVTSLESLNLGHNHLTYQEHLVNGYVSLFSENATLAFQNLHDLDLSYNQLNRFKFNIPFYMYNYSLKQLNLSHNNITEMIFDSQNEPILELVMLDLAYNSIAELNSDHVYLTNTPKSLEVIYLNNNKIQHLDPAFILNVPTLRSLKLSNNLLTSLNLRSTHTIGKSERIVLELAGNPWICDCHLEWLKELISNPSSNYLVQDYNHVMCSRQFHRFRDISVPLFQAMTDRDFLCTFAFQNKTCSESTDTQCAMPCPKPCMCYRSSNWKVIIVDCHGMNLTAIPIVIPEMTTSWYLDANSFPQLEILPHLPSLSTLFLNHTSLQSINGEPFSNVPALQYLFLQNNMLEILPEGIFENITNLLVLNLAFNRLSMPSVNLFLPLVSLETLHLNDNRLRESPVWNLRNLSQLSSIVLYGNPWSCECSFVLDLTLWMYNESRKLVGSDRMYCLSSENSEPVFLNWFDRSVCMNPISTLTQDQPIILISLLTVVIMILLVIFLVFLYRHEMQVLIYSRYGLRIFNQANCDADVGKLYDAFLSYSSLDEDFVINELLPGLEEIPKPYRLCLHHRDFPIGAFINESIFQAIDSSCRTIIVLSQNFVQSEWCRFEFRTAHAQMLQDRQNRVIVIILGKLPPDADIGPEMRLYLRTNTYLSWGDKLFWKKLYFVLPDMINPLTEEFVQNNQFVAEDEL